MIPDETTLRALARENARKIADFAQAWYAGEVDGKDDFRFVAHITGDIEAVLQRVAALQREQDAPYMEQQWQLIVAVINAIGEISKQEAIDALERELFHKETA